jgi:hypothetical protein
MCLRTPARWGSSYDRRAAFAPTARDPRAAAQVRSEMQRLMQPLEGGDLSEQPPVERRAALPTLVAGLDVPRETLEKQIRTRTAAMFERGWRRSACSGDIVPRCSASCRAPSPTRRHELGKRTLPACASGMVRASPAS